MIDASVRSVNAQGRSFTLQGDDLTFVDIRPLQAFRWSYELTNRLGGGGVAEGFARFPRTVDLTVRLRGRTRTDFISRVNDLHAVADADAVAETPGRLWVGSQYLGCYLSVAGSVETEPRTGNFATLAVTVLAVEPWWCTEVTTTVNPASAQADTSGKKYDLRYAYRYGTAIGPMFGAAPYSKPYLFVAYGVYGDPTRFDNDHQVLLGYDLAALNAAARPLQEAIRHGGEELRPVGRYFVFTGNTTYGVQNLEYDAATGHYLMAVYPKLRPMSNWGLSI